MNKIVIERKTDHLYVVRDSELYSQPVSAAEAIGIVIATLAPKLGGMRCHLKTAYEHKKQKASIERFLKLDGQIDNINLPQDEI